MSDTPLQDNSTQTATAPSSKHDVSLSDHAEDVLADAAGHGVELISDAENVPEQTVKEVLSELIGDMDELVITLEYGAGQSGVDQASWDIEVSALQRAFLRKQRAEEIGRLSDQLEDEIYQTREAIDAEWIERTLEFKALIKAFDGPEMSRQQVDDFQHRIFGRDSYLGYVDSVMNGSDEKRLFNAAANLKLMSQQLESDVEEMTNPEHADNNQLADAIIRAGGDIDILSKELERDFPSAQLRVNMTHVQEITDVINEEFLKQFKLWAHSFDLNLREVLATEKSATNGPVSEKAQAQLKDMLQSGTEQIDAIMEVIA